MQRNRLVDNAADLLHLRVTAIGFHLSDCRCGVALVQPDSKGQLRQFCRCDAFQ